jgi:hypothetical protein
MGDAPKIIEGLRLTREQLRETERQRYLDPATGELKAEADPAEDPQARPAPMPVARQTFD